jgi:hypothetical protein
MMRHTSAVLTEESGPLIVRGFYFHPVRYTSLGLSLLKTMMIGIPIVGLATSSSAIKNGISIAQLCAAAVVVTGSCRGRL